MTRQQAATVLTTVSSQHCHHRREQRQLQQGLRQQRPLLSRHCQQQQQQQLRPGRKALQAVLLPPRPLRLQLPMQSCCTRRSWLQSTILSSCRPFGCWASLVSHLPACSLHLAMRGCRHAGSLLTQPAQASPCTSRLPAFSWPTTPLPMCHTCVATAHTLIVVP